jgi:hypothetical protein
MIGRAVALFLAALLLVAVAITVALLAAGDDLPELVAWIVFALLVLGVAALLYPLERALRHVHLGRRLRRHP